MRWIASTMLLVGCLASNATGTQWSDSVGTSAEGLAVAESDSVGVLLELVGEQAREIDHLRLDNDSLERERDYWEQKAKDLQPPWWKEVLRDPRLWMAVGFYLGVEAAD